MVLVWLWFLTWVHTSPPFSAHHWGLIPSRNDRMASQLWADMKSEFSRTVQKHVKEAEKMIKFLIETLADAQMETQSKVSPALLNPGTLFMEWNTSYHI